MLIVEIARRQANGIGEAREIPDSGIESNVLPFNLEIDLVVCLAFQLAPVALAAQAAPDEAAILAAVQALYDGVKARDTTALRRVVAPDFAMMALGDVNGARPFRRTTGDSFVRLVGESKESLEETLHRPVVQQHGDLATVSGDFTFRRDGGSMSVITNALTPQADVVRLRRAQ